MDYFDMIELKLVCPRCGYETPMAENEEELMDGGRIEQFLVHHLEWECNVSRVEIFSNGRVRKHLMET